MNLQNLFRGKFIRRLITLYIFLGLIPALLLSGLSAGYLWFQNSELSETLNQQIITKSEADLINMIELQAQNYSIQLREKEREVNLIASFLSEQVQIATSQQAESNTYQTINHPTGWKTNLAEDELGLAISPLAECSPEMIQRQNAVYSILPFLRSIHFTDPTIRSTFIVTSDQTGLIYPNRFWPDGEYTSPTNPDYTARSYYQETNTIRWSDPYLDIDPEITVVTVTAPILVDGQKYGIVGIDFTINTILSTILETKVGEQGFLFLLGSDGQIIALPELASGWLVENTSRIAPEHYYDQAINQFVSDEVKENFDNSNLVDILQIGGSGIFQTHLISGDAYIALSPLDDVPWYMAVVLPVAETTSFMNQVGDLISQNTSVIYFLLAFTLVGFFILIIIGGIYNLRELALPIQNLAKGSSEISSGNLEYRVPRGQGENELTHLIDNFNQMADSILVMRESIEDQRNETEKNLLNLQSEHTAILKVTSLITREGKLDSIIKEAMDEIIPVTKAAAASTLLLDQSGTPSDTISSFSSALKDVADLTTYNKNCLEHPEILRSVSSRKEAFYSRGSENFISFKAIIDECLPGQDFQSVQILPVISNGKFLALLVLFWQKGDEPHEQTQSFINVIAHQIGLLIEHSHFMHQNRDLVIIEERRKLARDLHDSAVQTLFTIGLTIEGLLSHCSNFNPREREKVEFLDKQVNQIRREMRSLINELRPINIEDGQLEQAIHEHIESLRRVWGIPVDISISGQINYVPYKMQQSLNRVIQEALNNIGKHANASKVLLDLLVTEELIALVIQDDGDGFNIQKIHQHDSPSMGLQIMRERVEMMGGMLKIRSEEETGTTITISIPLPGDQE